MPPFFGSLLTGVLPFSPNASLSQYLPCPLLFCLGAKMAALKKTRPLDEALAPAAPRVQGFFISIIMFN